MCPSRGVICSAPRVYDPPVGMLRFQPVGPRKADIELIAVALGAVGLAALLAHPLWSRFHEPPCVLKTATGIPCAFCGGTRAALAWARLDFAAAVAWNPLVGIGVWVFGAWWIYCVFAVATRRPNRLRLDLSARRNLRMFQIAVISALLANWAYVIATGR